MDIPHKPKTHPSPPLMAFGFGAKVWVPARKTVGIIMARWKGPGDSWVYLIEFPNGTREELPNAAVLLVREDQERRGHVELVVDNDPNTRAKG